MGYLPYSCGFQRITASGVISDSGKPILITGFEVLSGASAAVPYFKNGTAITDPTAFRGDGTASVAQTTAFNLPVMLGSGCFVSFDANTTEVTVYYILQALS